MNTETVARVVAALQKNDGLLTVASAKKEGVSKTTLLRAAELGVAVKRTARNKYAALDAAPRRLALRGAYLGQEAVLSFEGAQYYWGYDGISELTLVWSIPHGGRAQLPNVVRRRNFGRLEVIQRDGVLVTSPAQTLLDIAARADLDIVERAYESALRRGLVDDIAMREWVEEHAGWHGAPGLRVVQQRREPGERPTGSDVETICLQRCLRPYAIAARRQLRADDANGELIGFGDFGFPPKACVLEVDGLGTHDVANRQHDYDRQARMEDAGYLVRRVTAEDVLYRPKYVLRRVQRGIELARPLVLVPPKFDV